ncbi:MAG TPA: hypothetical protein VEB59_12030 [Gemmatimonadales bacterium]|nr:hypothetical protein [Gemmatimonadales bacterium]
MAREVDRLLAQLERTGRPEPAVARTPSGPQRRITRVASAKSPSYRERAGLWARVALGIVLGAVMTQWPYPYVCGAGLAGYLGAVMMVVVAAVWGAAAAWRQRCGEAHVLALVLVLWGIALGAERVLPRIGYAAERAEWKCEGV